MRWSVKKSKIKSRRKDVAIRRGSCAKLDATPFKTTSGAHASSRRSILHTDMPVAILSGKKQDTGHIAIQHLPRRRYSATKMGRAIAKPVYIDGDTIGLASARGPSRVGSPLYKVRRRRAGPILAHAPLRRPQFEDEVVMEQDKVRKRPGECGLAVHPLPRRQALETSPVGFIVICVTARAWSRPARVGRWENDCRGHLVVARRLQADRSVH
jgi:hypothetical protein